MYYAAIGVPLPAARVRSQDTLASRQRLSSFTLCTPFLVLKHSISLVFVLRMSITGVRRPPCDRHRTRGVRRAQHCPCHSCRTVHGHPAACAPFRLPARRAPPRRPLACDARHRAPAHGRHRVLSWPFHLTCMRIRVCGCYVADSLSPPTTSSQSSQVRLVRRTKNRRGLRGTIAGPCGNTCRSLGTRNGRVHR